jgi:membrane dipeptidase
MTSLLWDQHACLPLQTDTDVDPLTRYQRCGGAFVSINAGYTPHSFNDTTALLQHYRAAVNAHPHLELAASINDVAAITLGDRIAVLVGVGGAPPTFTPSLVATSTASPNTPGTLDHNRCYLCC